MERWGGRRGSAAAGGGDEDRRLGAFRAPLYPDQTPSVSRQPALPAVPGRASPGGRPSAPLRILFLALSCCTLSGNCRPPQPGPCYPLAASVRSPARRLHFFVQPSSRRAAQASRLPGKGSRRWTRSRWRPATRSCCWRPRRGSSPGATAGRGPSCCPGAWGRAVRTVLPRREPARRARPPRAAGGPSTPPPAPRPQVLGHQLLVLLARLHSRARPRCKKV